MKALKHENATYVDQIVSAIQSCYAQSQEPTNAQLTALYSMIGKCICQQGETAFVAYLAKLIMEQLPQHGGFSMRNLRRMRDFYRTYENQPELMQKAQTLGWTQNAVVLDCCDTDAQRSFYMELASEKKLSKLALMRAIAAESFEAETEETAAEECDPGCRTVGISTPEEAVDTIDTVKTQWGAFVTACEPLRQGDAPQLHYELHKTADYDEVFGNAANSTDMMSLQYDKSLIGTAQKVIAQIQKMSISLHQAEQWERVLDRLLKGKSSSLVTLAGIYMDLKLLFHAVPLSIEPVTP